MLAAHFSRFPQKMPGRAEKEAHRQWPQPEAYAGRDSLHDGVGVVKPPTSKRPPDTCILSFESQV